MVAAGAGAGVDTDAGTGARTAGVAVGAGAGAATGAVTTGAADESPRPPHDKIRPDPARPRVLFCIKLSKSESKLEFSRAFCECATAARTTYRKGRRQNLLILVGARPNSQQRPLT